MLLDQESMGSLVIEFKDHTGIRIFYEPGNAEMQNHLEIDHSVNNHDCLPRRILNQLGIGPGINFLCDNYIYFFNFRFGC